MIFDDSNLYDPVLADEGKWHDIKVGGKVRFSFRLRYVDPATQKGDLEYKRARAPYAKEIRTNVLDSVELAIIALSSVHCIDWKGVTSGGKPVPYTPENGRAFFKLDQHRAMAMECLEVATDRNEFAPEPDFDVVEIVKN